MRLSIAALCLALSATTATAQSCGGSFGDFVQRLKAEALSRGYERPVVDQFFASASYSQAVINADRAQGIFRMEFVDFTQRLISQNRLDGGRANAQRYSGVFDQINARWGIPRGMLLSFWAFETDYGGFQGDFNTRDALITLAHDCRRPELFLPQVYSALELFKRGDFSTQTTGAWAGEIGQVQMLPGDILNHGIDGDGDGHVRLKESAPDALMSGANLLASFGWAPNQPWLQEVAVPDNLDWSQTGLRTKKTPQDWAAMGVQPRSGQFEANGLPSSILLPQGRKGPAFIAYPNYETLFEWNQSFVYVTTAAYFATRLMGAPPYNPGNPDPVLSLEDMKALQRKLAAMGYDVGDIDGILGAGTRAAVQAVQVQLGLPADAWPTRELLNRL
ncbi:lytic murein transglycosylase [Anianabacter salinae]|uniref:lytic murein transglycosylase n=1 Tax=Anianabacter salinae TaxID=2851023 RepID=UPI00225E1F0F|nr:lytic murein transglycosylase [Anianabacter salinae]MBV0910766.1 lytic murein transglycosylase [Anianabacter salinae]